MTDLTKTLWIMRERESGVFELWQEGSLLSEAEWIDAFNDTAEGLQNQLNLVMTSGSGVSAALTAQALAGQKNLVVPTTGFAVGDAIYIGRGTAAEAHIIASITDATHMATTANLAGTFAIGQPVSKSPVELVEARGVFGSLGRRLDRLEARVFDVKKYGAVGDGVANDLAAFQAAETALIAAGGGVIWVPPGSYKVGLGWTLTADKVHVELSPGARVFTDGATTNGATIAFVGGGYGLGLAVTPQSTWASIGGGGRVDNLNNGTLDNAVAFARYQNARCVGIRIPLCGRKAITAQYGVDNVYIADNIIGTSAFDAISIESTCDNVEVRGNLIENAAGVGILATTSITDLRIFDNVILQCGGNGISSSGATRAWIERNTVRLAGGIGIISPSGTELVIRGNEVYNPQQHGISITATAGRCEVQDNYISGAGQAAAATYDAIVFTSLTCRPRVDGNRTDGALHRYNVNALSMAAYAPLVPPTNIFSGGATSAFGGTVPAANEYSGNMHPMVVNSTTVDTGAANRGILVPFIPRQDKTITKAHFRVGVQSGNIDVAIYDQTLARLTSTGSTAMPAVGPTSVNFTAGITLRAGVLYYIGVAMSNTTGKLYGWSGVGAIVTGQNLIRRMEAALPLPATFVVAADDDIAVVPGVWVAP